VEGDGLSEITGKDGEAIKSETRFPQTKSVDDTVARFSKARSATATDRYLLAPAPSWNSAGSLVRTEIELGLAGPL
jgi:hypothetical protein